MLTIEDECGEHAQTLTCTMLQPRMLSKHFETDASISVFFTWQKYTGTTKRENPVKPGVLFSHGLAKFVLKFRKGTSEARISSRPWCWPSLLVGQSHSTADSLAQQIDMSSDQVTCRFDTFWHGEEIASVIQIVQLYGLKTLTYHRYSQLQKLNMKLKRTRYMYAVVCILHNISLCQF